MAYLPPFFKSRKRKKVRSINIKVCHRCCGSKVGWMSDDGRTIL
jgi:hypothetical protein